MSKHEKYVRARTNLFYATLKIQHNSLRLERCFSSKCGCLRGMGLTSAFISSTTKSISHSPGARLMTYIVRFNGLLLLNASSLRGRLVNDI
ncbi:TPA: leu operon leader peptide [Citrobacter gillenii]